VAKGGSARNVYVPDGVLRALHDYVEADRAEAVERARATGRYEAMAGALVVEDRERARVRVQGRWKNVADLAPEQRRQVLVCTDDGLEPAALWLGDDGAPLTVHAWKWHFRQASRRCRKAGVEIYCHPHALRHSFAVITLEQLQRAHFDALSAVSAEQRRHYRMIWGDPLDWVRIRLGHASAETTQKYLHTLKELEMETRFALVPALWESPDEHYLADVDRAAESVPGVCG
jgi:integrase